MSVYVSGIGIISSLGKNYSEHKQHLFDLKEGISKHLYKNHDSILESYTGSITSDPEVPEQYKDETRNFKFAFTAFEEALASSGVNLKAYHNIAVCFRDLTWGKECWSKCLVSI